MNGLQLANNFMKVLKSQNDMISIFSIGGVIGALAGAVVGQFFTKCTDTWDQYRVREVKTVPCKRSRYYTKEEKWMESACNSFKQKVISEFGVPASCNCTDHCVMTQEPSCLDNYQNCLSRRRLGLKSFLQSANVFNETALDFMELEKVMVGWSKNCLLYTSPSPRDGLLSRMPSSA